MGAALQKLCELQCQDSTKLLTEGIRRRITVFGIVADLSRIHHSRYGRVVSLAEVRSTYSPRRARLTLCSRQGHLNKPHSRRWRFCAGKSTPKPLRFTTSHQNHSQWWFPTLISGTSSPRPTFPTVGVQHSAPFPACGQTSSTGTTRRCWPCLNGPNLHLSESPSGLVVLQKMSWTPCATTLHELSRWGRTTAPF